MAEQVEDCEEARTYFCARCGKSGPGGYFCDLCRQLARDASRRKLRPHREEYELSPWQENAVRALEETRDDK
jgi:hypothetical protein